jgi:catechol 2,3-dioxygenase-like lactoylglutathione lyase family enzyme
MNGLIKIDSIMFRVTDLDASAAFYSGVLGLKQVWRDDDRQMIGFAFPASDSEVVIHTNPDIPNPDFSFLVNDVTAFAQTYRDGSHAVLVEPFDVRAGKFAVLSDPDGNAISIIDLTRFGGEPRYDPE